MVKKPGNPGFFHPEIIKSAAKLLKMSESLTVLPERVARLRPQGQARRRIQVDRPAPISMPVPADPESADTSVEVHFASGVGTPA